MGTGENSASEGADGLNPQLQAAVLMLIETGARPSEILNHEPDDIRFDAAVPHIKIRPRKGRQLKTEPAQRDVPLVGVSLEATRRVPDGLPHYRDKGNLFSSACGGAFRNRGLVSSSR